METGPTHTDGLVVRLQSLGVDSKQIHDVVIGSVVPRLTSLIEQAIKKSFNISPLMASTDLDAGLILHYADSRKLGVDRFVSAAMAYALYQTDLVVADFGTATTFSVVDEHGTYCGGAIAPGLGISADALVEKTAQLPRIDLQPPRSAIGNDTVSGIQSGVVLGHVSMVEGMIDRFQRELTRSIKVIGTGGFAPLIASLSCRINEVRPQLTLEGLNWLYHRQRSQ